MNGQLKLEARTRNLKVELDRSRSSVWCVRARNRNLNNEDANRTAKAEERYQIPGFLPGQ